LKLFKVKFFNVITIYVWAPLKSRIRFSEFDFGAILLNLPYAAYLGLIILAIWLKYVYY